MIWGTSKTSRQRWINGRCVYNVTNRRDKRFEDFILLEPIATFMFQTFGEDIEVDSLTNCITASPDLQPKMRSDSTGRPSAEVQGPPESAFSHMTTLKFHPAWWSFGSGSATSSSWRDCATCLTPFSASHLIELCRKGSCSQVHTCKVYSGINKHI